MDYAKQRIQGGRPIIQHSVLAAMLGEAAVKIESARSFICRSAWEIDERERAGKPLDLFWAFGNYYNVKKLAWLISQIGVEIYGGLAGSRDMPLERLLRRAICWTPSGNTPSMNSIKMSMIYNDHGIG